MNWREQLALILGAASPFGLAADAGATEPTTPPLGPLLNQPTIQKDLLVFRDPAARERLLMFADHRSHSSHSSHSSHYSGSGGHSSHSSHFSSSGGYVAPAPVRPAPAPFAKPRPRPAPVQRSTPSPLYTPPASTAAAPSSAARLSASELSNMVTKVQIALVVRGYKPGSVDGKLGPATRAAIASFQAANNQPVTGLMDLETLRLLGVEIGMATPPPAPVAAPTLSSPVNPVWLSKPTASEVARVFPERAQRMEKEGDVVITCVVDVSGHLVNCKVASESPADYGFGQAALTLARSYQADVNATPVGSEVSLPFVFRLPGTGDKQGDGKAGHNRLRGN